MKIYDFLLSIDNTLCNILNRYEHIPLLTLNKYNKLILKKPNIQNVVHRTEPTLTTD